MYVPCSISFYRYSLLFHDQISTKVIVLPEKIIHKIGLVRRSSIKFQMMSPVCNLLIQLTWCGNRLTGLTVMACETLHYSTFLCFYWILLHYYCICLDLYLMSGLPNNTCALLGLMRVFAAGRAYRSRRGEGLEGTIIYGVGMVG